jgi:hypothetical protein
MKCYKHRNREAIGICTICGKGICKECEINLYGKLYCKEDANEIFTKNIKKSENEEIRERPAGLTILGVFQIIISAAYFGLGAVLIFESTNTFGVNAIFGLLPRLSIIFIIVGGFTFIFGLGLLSGKRWARTLAMIGAVLDLFSIPIGTILGIVILWYLTRPHVVKYFYRKRTPGAKKNSWSPGESLDVIFNVPNSHVVAPAILGMFLAFVIFGAIIQSGLLLMLLVTWFIFFILGILSLDFVFKTRNKSLFVLSILFMSVSIGFLSLSPVYIFEKHYANKRKKQSSH